MSNKNRRFDAADQDYDEDYRPNKKKQSHRRRPVRNWKKAWHTQEDRADEVDEFFTK